MRFFSFKRAVLIISGLFFLFISGARAQTDIFRFKPQLGVCTSIRNYEIVAAAGFNYIEESVQRFLVPLKPDSIFRKNLAVLHESPIPIISCNGFLPGKLKSTGPETNHPAILAYADTAFRRAHEAGIHLIVFGSSGSRNYPEGFNKETALGQFTELLRKMGPIAAKYGVTVVIEPLRKKESNLINKVSEGMKIVMEINHPNIQVLGDIYHMRCESEPPGSLIEAADHLRHIHIAELANRTAPGVAGDNFYPYLKALKAIHYQGGISIEGRWGKDFPMELIKSRAYLLGQINTLN